MADERYRLVSDNDGHEYIVPADQEENFYTWVEANETHEDTDFDFADRRLNSSSWTFTDPQGWD